MIYLFTILLIVILKFLINIRKFFLCKKYLQYFFDWLNEDCKVNLSEAQPIVKRLVDEAGYADIRVPHVQSMGYGKLASYEANPFNAFPSRLKSVASVIISILSSSKGVYRQRAFESFNPLFWIEFIVFLPKNIFSYIGLSNKGTTVKVSNIIWWMTCTIIIPVVLSTYNDELTRIVRNIFN
ncbi:hypothetical protein [Peribacillus frigoritolerans]|uniref:hypothetical protein n=1 Tax=Peribacillus frigoritolerans TaxID=450367 RepID=UPI0010710945|nr:hypothetical protein [Peribacillus frigoritolerans]TFH62629.1 hypothetical protein E4J71_02165 [Peribacillus frigoritolerans]